jgi:hypothetical protein
MTNSESNPPSATQMKVEVAYADESRQSLISVSLAPAATVLDAILAADILSLYPAIVDLQKRVGIFGKKAGLETKLKEGDRVEIYRDLYRDPKETRRMKAKAQRISSNKRTT